MPTHEPDEIMICCRCERLAEMCECLHLCPICEEEDCDGHDDLPF